MFERFTAKAIKTIMLAQEEARRLGHNWVGTEQILLGLIGEGTGIASSVLQSRGVDLKTTRIEIEKIIGRGAGKVAIEIPFTPNAKRVLELSWDEARQLTHDYIGTEHLLLGLMRAGGDSVAARVLNNMGVSLASLGDDVRAAIPRAQPVTATDKQSEQQQLLVYDQTIHLIDISTFTGGTMETIVLAREESRKARQDEVDTEHLLLGLLQSRGEGAAVLRDNGITYDIVRLEVDKLPQTIAPVPIHIPFSYSATRVIVRAWRESRSLGHRLVHSDHILLGLIRETEDNTAAEILKALGISFARLQEQLIERLSQPSDEPGILQETEPSSSDDEEDLSDKILYWQAQAKRAQRLEQDAHAAEERCRVALAKLKGQTEN
jgi:ATP-dependent Clp protease ATP-binding subunit ClpA